MKRSPDTLTTTEAAQILYCSRQHVVHLCDTGKLPYVLVGKHRRINRRDVERLDQPQYQRSDELSLWLHYACAAKLVMDPQGVIERAKVRLESLRRTHGNGGIKTWLDRWQVALDEGPIAVLAVMTDRSQAGQVMRSSSPITGLGLLTSEERTQVRSAFKTYWTEHLSEAV